MANTASAKKECRKSIKRRIANVNNVSKIRTFIKKISNLVDNNKVQEAKELFKTIQSVIMKGVTKKVIKLNTASRKISRLSKKIKSAAG
jgi:small subunit ribosomal protein S20